MYYLCNIHFTIFFGFVLLNCCESSDLMEGYKAMENSDDSTRGDRSLWTQCQAVADMKFTYIVSCQQYGIDKRSGSLRAQDILRLMTR
jgi:callose synthase